MSNFTPNDNYEDIQRLVNDVQSGNTASLHLIFEFYQPLVKASISRCLKKEPLLRTHSDDMLGESLLVMQDLIEDYKAELSYFSYYLAMRFDYYLISRCKKMYLGINTSGNGVIEMPINEDALQISHDPFNKNEFKQELTECIKQLKIDQQTVIDLYFYQRLTQAESAEAMGISQAAFSKKLRKTLKDLKELYTFFSNNFKN